jgi:hypothetical protein
MKWNKDKHALSLDEREKKEGKKKKQPSVINHSSFVVGVTLKGRRRNSVSKDTVEGHVWSPSGIARVTQRVRTPPTR